MWLLRKKYRHEVFISHAVEDKLTIANDLCIGLKAAGLKVWYSGDQLTTGEDLHRSIEEAIDQSRFGVVVFSKTFINDKTWTLKELSWLIKKEKNNIEVVLPVLHNITVKELAEFDPRLAMKVCADGSRGIDVVVQKILRKIDDERKKEDIKKQKAIALTSIVAFIIVAFAGLYAYKVLNHRPGQQQIQASIMERVNTFLNTIESRYAGPLKTEGILIGKHQIDSIKHAYDDVKSYYRNEYEFNNGNTTIRGRKNVEAYIGRNVIVMADQPGYGMDSVEAFWANKSIPDGFSHAGFSMLNKRPVEFTWNGRSEDNGYVVDVSYTNEIRYINVSLTFPPVLTGTKRHEMTLLGLAPLETFYFEEGSDGEWYLKKVE